eukprot:g26919.t1
MCHMFPGAELEGGAPGVTETKLEKLHHSKCWLLEELQLRVDELESELQTLRYIWEGEKYLDALFQEVVAAGRLSTTNLVRGQGQEGVTASEAGRGILQSEAEQPQLLTLSN